MKFASAEVHFSPFCLWNIRNYKVSNCLNETGHLACVVVLLGKELPMFGETETARFFGVLVTIDQIKQFYVLEDCCHHMCLP
jgi:hypothetical protein